MFFTESHFALYTKYIPIFFDDYYMILQLKCADIENKATDTLAPKRQLNSFWLLKADLKNFIVRKTASSLWNAKGIRGFG